MGLDKSVGFMVIMVLVAFFVSSCSGATAGEIWGYHKNNAKEKYADAKEAAKEAAESWTGWVTDNVSQKLALFTRYQSTGSAKSTKDTITDSASG